MSGGIYNSGLGAGNGLTAGETGAGVNWYLTGSEEVSFTQTNEQGLMPAVTPDARRGGIGQPSPFGNQALTQQALFPDGLPPAAQFVVQPPTTQETTQPLILTGLQLAIETEITRSSPESLAQEFKWQKESREAGRGEFQEEVLASQQKFLSFAVKFQIFGPSINSHATCLFGPKLAEFNQTTSTTMAQQDPMVS
jgi:hypothetical protein